MSPADVLKLIADEIASAGEGWLTQPGNNSHGLDLSQCLIEPQLVTCNNTFPEFRAGKPFDAWLVLKEVPSGGDGYLIIYDEQSGNFGLAYGTNLEPAFIGWHGSFLNTLRGM